MNKLLIISSHLGIVGGIREEPTAVLLQQHKQRKAVRGEPVVIQHCCVALPRPGSGDDTARVGFQPPSKPLTNTHAHWIHQHKCFLQASNDVTSHRRVLCSLVIEHEPERLMTTRSQHGSTQNTCLYPYPTTRPSALVPPVITATTSTQKFWF